MQDILSRMPPSRQTMLFSATLPRLLIEFSRAGLKDPEFVRLDVESRVSPNLRMAFLAMRTEEKAAILLYICRELIKEGQQTIIFVATRHHVEYTTAVLRAFGMGAMPVYGSMDMEARQDNVVRIYSTSNINTYVPTSRIVTFRTHSHRCKASCDVEWQWQCSVVVDTASWLQRSC